MKNNEIAIVNVTKMNIYMIQFVIFQIFVYTNNKNKPFSIGNETRNKNIKYALTKKKGISLFSFRFTLTLNQKDKIIVLHSVKVSLSIINSSLFTRLS